MVCRRLICTAFALAVITTSAFAQGKLNGAKKDMADRNYITAIDKLQKQRAYWPIAIVSSTTPKTPNIGTAKLLQLPKAYQSISCIMP
jgi:hypothetical protein